MDESRQDLLSLFFGVDIMEWNRIKRSRAELHHCLLDTM